MSVVETGRTPPLLMLRARNVIEAVPRLSPPRDATRPVVVAGSLLAHGAAIVALLLFSARDRPLQPREIPVEIVQLPPKPAGKAEASPAEKSPIAQRQIAQRPVGQRQVAQPEPSKPPPKPASQPRTAKPPPHEQMPKEPPKPAAATPRPRESTADRLKDLLGPMPGLAAVALPGGSAAGTEAVSYSRLVMSRIALAKKQGRYPGVPGFATVEFVLGDGGEVTSLDLRRPSGDASLDSEALALVKRGEPYPAPPPGGRRDYVVTLEFRAML